MAQVQLKPASECLCRVQVDCLTGYIHLLALSLVQVSQTMGNPPFVALSGKALGTWAWQWLVSSQNTLLLRVYVCLVRLSSSTCDHPA